MKRKLKTIKKAIAKYVYTNRLFLTYFILAITGTILLRGITFNRFLAIKPLLTDMGLILVIGSLGYLLKPEQQYRYFLLCLTFFATVEVINSVYYIFYSSFASLAELSTLSQAETVTDSIYSQLRIIDFIYLLVPLIFYKIHSNLKNSPYYNLMGKIENKKRRVLTTLVAGIILLGISFATASRTDYSRLSKQWNRTYIVERFGILMYQFNDIFQTIKPKISNLFGYENAYALFNNYFEDETINRYDKKNKYTGILKGYNIVYVHLESMQNILMDLEFNNVKVAPNLEKLSKEGMFFNNFYSQISIGTSSDAEYMMLTGLLPSSSGTVFVTYSNNTFNTIATHLKERDYYTFSMHGNYSAMWNRSVVHPKLGYDEMYFRDTFEFNPEADVIGLGINDKLFFKQAIQKLEKIETDNKNYFGTVITLSNHSPFKGNEAFTLDIADHFINAETGMEETTCYLCEKDIGRYLVSSHYADEALGEFINYIKESNKFNNTVFVFYGDHDAKMSYKDMNYLYNYDYMTGELKDEMDPSYKEYDSYDHYLNKKTPLIIWTKNKKLSKIFKGKVSYTMGMYDAIPTLYNMLDIKEKYVLGHDIFNIKNDNIVVFPNGNYLTNKVYYNNSTGEYKVLKDNAILDEDYIKQNEEYSELALEVGNAIINYDLFKDKKEK
jgi:phosphoglycerol transferase MdoB-like AlkP superfamily enzyme